MTTVSIHQSNYLPGVRLIDKIRQSDVFVFLDEVELSRQDWPQRNRVRGRNGDMLLTVPVYQKWGQKICEAVINDKVPWRIKHWRTLEQCYSKSLRWHEIGPRLKLVYDDLDCKLLSEVNKRIMKIILDGLGIKVRIVDSLVVEHEGEKNDRLIRMVKALGCERYISSAGSRIYIDEEKWAGAGIEHVFQRFDPEPYAALYPEFDPSLSMIDFLLCSPKLF